MRLRCSSLVKQLLADIQPNDVVVVGASSEGRAVKFQHDIYHLHSTERELLAYALRERMC